MKVFMKVKAGHGESQTAERYKERGVKTWRFLADLVPLRAGRPLRSPGPGEGSEGAAEAQPAASQTVSGGGNAPRHHHLSG